MRPISSRQREGSRLVLAAEQHGPQRKDDRTDPDDHGGLPFRGGRLFHKSITPKGSRGSQPSPAVEEVAFR
jgi:hypothetical protein